MVSLVCQLSLSLSAHAFAPTETPGVALEPQRIWWRHDETQGRLLTSPQWRAFQESDGRGWQARFDEGTGVPRWLWGRGIPMSTSSPQQLADQLVPLLERHAGLLGFEAGTLSLRSARYSERYDTWYVELDTLREGLPTYRGGISARVKGGNLVMLKVMTAPDAPVRGDSLLSAEQAIVAAIAAGPAPRAVHSEQSAVPMLLERRDQRGMYLQRTFMVRSRTGSPPGIWVSFVDAGTGELLNVHNEVRFIAGTLQGRHHERHPASALVDSPLPFAIVDGQFDSDVTDIDGDYNVTAGTVYETTLNGDYVDVTNYALTDGFLSDNDPDLLWTTADASQSEIDTYKFIHDVKAWGDDVEPSVASVSYYGGQLTAVVDINQNCNAYYDGLSVNFFVAGSGCNNTGEIADVVYHEWGHGFHLMSLLAGTFDGSLSEGASDVVAFFQTGDNYIAPYFGTNGAAIRDVAPDMVYPQDFVNNSYYVHYNGLIFGGAMWDLLDLLQDDLGNTAGQDVAESIFAGLLKGGPEIPDSYFEALLADDDDNTLDNGTPHQCQLDEAFARHGLASVTVSGGFLTSHTPLSLEPEGVAVEVDVELLSVGCQPTDPDSGTVHYRVDGGNWQTVPASVSGTHVIGDIPAQALGTFVEYWVDGEDENGDAFQAPSTGEVAPFSFFVGDVIEVHCDDFESDDGGYSHELVSGEEGDGADDWQWGEPAGQGGDPAAAFSGDNVWGNDLGLEGYNGLYQAEKVNRLFSPAIDTLWYTDVFLHYQRWLHIEDSTYDQGVITANGVEVWRNYQGAGDDQHLDGQWVAHAVDLQGEGDQTLLEVGFELHSDGGLEFGGWTVDDVCVYAPATPDNRLGIVDLVVTDRGGPIELTWTNPIHAPVDRVVVVRRVDDWPTSWQDGDLVADITDPDVGEAEQVVHNNSDGTSGHYTVYASDGSDWLSWTVEGWNAGYAAPNSGGPSTGDDDDDDVTGDDDDDDDDDDDVVGDNEDEVPELEDGQKPVEPGGCGCDNTGAPTGLAGLLALGLLAVRRRR
jgi:MYXO-CTERM domain-containing protein